MVKSIKPQVFDVEVQGGGAPLLVAFLKRNDRLPSQVKALERAELARRGRIRCFLFNADYLGTASERFAVEGTPTFILFDQGHEVDRLIGESDTDVLDEFLDNALGW